MEIISEEPTAAAMEIISEEPTPAAAGGNKRSWNSYTYTYTHNCKRVGAPKGYEEGMDRRGRGQIQKKLQCHEDKACTYWLAGNCKYAGDDCKYLHSHVVGGSDVTFLTNLVGHDNKVFAFLELYVRVWWFLGFLIIVSWFLYFLCIFI